MKREAPGSFFPIGCDFFGSLRDTTLPRVVGVNAAMQHLEVQVVFDFLLELVARIISIEFVNVLLDRFIQLFIVKLFIKLPLLLLAGLVSDSFLGRLVLVIGCRFLTNCLSCLGLSFRGTLGLCFGLGLCFRGRWCCSSYISFWGMSVI